MRIKYFSPSNLLVLFFFIPLLLMLFGLGSHSTLSGLTLLAQGPDITSDSLVSGNFQHQFEQWIIENFPYKDAIVRFENTLNLEIFNEVLLTKSGTPLVLGKSNYLFEKSHINKYNGVVDLKVDMPRKSLDPNNDLIPRLGKAAKIFRKHRINFVILFYPHKAWIYPEYIDERWLLPHGHLRAKQEYENLLAKLHNAEVPMIDSAKIFENLKATQPQSLLFNRGGTHWTHYGACLVLKEMIELMSSQNLQSFPRIECQVDGHAPSSGVYLDIARILNILSTDRFIEEVPLVSINYEKVKLKSPLQVLMVKTSFSEQLRTLLEKAQYANTDQQFPYYSHQDQNKIDWNKDIFSKQWIILEQSQWSYLSQNIEQFLSDLESHSEIYKNELKDLQP